MVLKGELLSAAFLDACNYGLGYLFFCPFVYLLVSYFLKSAILPAEDFFLSNRRVWLAEIGMPHARIAAIVLGHFLFWSVVVSGTLI
jgi:hypothetical protein